MFTSKELAQFGLTPHSRIFMDEGIFFWDMRNNGESKAFSCELPLCKNGDYIRVGYAYETRWISDHFVVTSMYLVPIDFTWEVTGHYWEDGQLYEETLHIDYFVELAF